MVSTHEIALKTRGDNDVHDLTGEVSGAARASGVRNGIVTVFVAGSTAGITTIEHEPGMVRDLQEFLDRLSPEDARYHHNHGGDSNGHAHVRAAFIGPSLTVPLVDGPEAGDVAADRAGGFRRPTAEPRGDGADRRRVE